MFQNNSWIRKNIHTSPSCECQLLSPHSAASRHSVQIWIKPICAGQWIFQFLADSFKRKSAWKADGLVPIYFCSSVFPLPVLTPQSQLVDCICENWIELVRWNMMHYIACLLCCCHGNGRHIGWPNCVRVLQ